MVIKNNVKTTTCNREGIIVLSSTVSDPMHCMGVLCCKKDLVGCFGLKLCSVKPVLSRPHIKQTPSIKRH